MTIKILQFQVVETFISRGRVRKFIDMLLGNDELDQYHFDVRIKIADLPPHLSLKEQDIVQLENGVKLIIWSRDRENMFKAKTTRMTVEDLREYKPIRMFLDYTKTHGRISY